MWNSIKTYRTNKFKKLYSTGIYTDIYLVALYTVVICYSILYPRAAFLAYLQRMTLMDDHGYI